MTFFPFRWVTGDPPDSSKDFFIAEKFVVKIRCYFYMKNDSIKQRLRPSMKLWKFCVPFSMLNLGSSREISSMDLKNYLWFSGKKELALTSLQWLRGKDADVKKEFCEIEGAAMKNQKSDNFIRNLFTKVNMKPVAITIGLMFFQQFSGVNAVIFYATKIFEVSHRQSTSSHQQKRD